jgi:hypothetical protein
MSISDSYLFETCVLIFSSHHSYFVLRSCSKTLMETKKNIFDFVKKSTNNTSSNAERPTGKATFRLKSESLGNKTLSGISQVTMYTSKSFPKSSSRTAQIYNPQGCFVVQFPEASDVDIFSRLCDSLAYQNAAITFHNLSQTGEKQFTFLKGVSTVQTTKREDIVVDWSLSDVSAVLSDMKKMDGQSLTYLRYKVPSVIVKYDNIYSVIILDGNRFVH